MTPEALAAITASPQYFGVHHVAPGKSEWCEIVRLRASDRDALLAEVRHLTAENARLRAIVVFANDEGHWCGSAVVAPGAAWHLTIAEHERWNELLDGIDV